MWRAFDEESIPKSLHWPVVTLGVFDGVHRGHQAVLKQVIRLANRHGGEALVITFDRHPRTLLDAEAPPLITSLEHRLVLFERLGIDGALVLRFDHRQAAMSAAQFVEHFLIRRLAARAVVLGFNSRFGRGAEGDIELLRRYEAENSFEVCRGRPVYSSGQPVSSTAIRRAITEGRLGEARRMLGRPVSLLGTVIRGDGRGRSLGFPTANLDLHHEVAPPAGVYATWTRHRQRWLPSVASIGPRPTYDDDTAPGTVEVHLIDRRGLLYGRDLEVQFVRRLRGQRRFADALSLAQQIGRDVDRTRRLLAHRK